MPYLEPNVAEPQKQPAGVLEDTATTVHNHNNGYSSDSRAHYSSSYTPLYDADQQSRFNQSPTLSTYQPQLPPPSSRPSSGLSSGAERHGYSQQSQDVQKQSSQAVSKNSVVIKVGMVGDAQIGKTSLMVKYVEGSWDEDYIQTLGELASLPETRIID